MLESTSERLKLILIIVQDLNTSLLATMLRDATEEPIKTTTASMRGRRR